MEQRALCWQVFQIVWLNNRMLISYKDMQISPIPRRLNAIIYNFKRLLFHRFIHYQSELRNFCCCLELSSGDGFQTLKNVSLPYVYIEWSLLLRIIFWWKIIIAKNVYVCARLCVCVCVHGLRASKNEIKKYWIQKKHSIILIECCQLRRSNRCIMYKLM